MFDGEVGVGHSLGLDPLRGVDHQKRTLACGQRSGHLVGEVHVAWGVDEVQRVRHVILHVLDAHGRGFDGDAAFTFQIHRIEHLGFGFTIRNRAGGLQQPIGQSALAVINVGDDGKVANRHSLPILGSPAGFASASPPESGSEQGNEAHDFQTAHGHQNDHA